MRLESFLTLSNRHSSEPVSSNVLNYLGAIHNTFLLQCLVINEPGDCWTYILETIIFGSGNKVVRYRIKRCILKQSVHALLTCLSCFFIIIIIICNQLFFKVIFLRQLTSSKEICYICVLLQPVLWALPSIPAFGFLALASIVCAVSKAVRLFRHPQVDFFIYIEIICNVDFSFK